MLILHAPSGDTSGLVRFQTLTTLKDAGLITPVIGKGYYVAGT